MVSLALNAGLTAGKPAQSGQTPQQIRAGHRNKGPALPAMLDIPGDIAATVSICVGALAGNGGLNQPDFADPLPELGHSHESQLVTQAVI